MNWTDYLDCLTPGQRDVFVLRYGRAGKPRSFADIAERLGISKQAAEQRHARGKRRIRSVHSVNG